MTNSTFLTVLARYVLWVDSKREKYMNIKITVTLVMVAFMPALNANADTLKSEYTTQVSRSMVPALVDAAIGSSCVKQVSPLGETVVKNTQECSNTLTELESNLGKDNDGIAMKRQILKFRAQYSLP